MPQSLVFKKCNKCGFYNAENANSCMNCKEVFVKIFFLTVKQKETRHCYFFCTNPPDKSKHLILGYLRQFPESKEQFWESYNSVYTSFEYDEIKESFSSAKNRVLQVLRYKCNRCSDLSQVKERDVDIVKSSEFPYENFSRYWQCLCGNYNETRPYSTPLSTEKVCSKCKLGRDPDHAMIEHVKKEQQWQQRQRDEEYIRNLQTIEDTEAARVSGKVRGMKELVKMMLDFTDDLERRNARFDENVLRSFAQATGIANAENNDLLNAAIQIAISQRRR